MADNNSLVVVEFVRRKINLQVILVQALVFVFLCINSMLIVTFSMKEHFYTSMRYILFANTLVSDCVVLIVTNLLLLMSYFQVTMQLWLCVIMYILSSLYTFITPVSLTMMTLERYIAICMPLQHADLCSSRRAFFCILIIYNLSSVTFVITLTIFLATVSLRFLKQYVVCSKEIFVIHSWQLHLRSGINQFYFLVMCCTIVFSYVKIMKVARAASGESKKSTTKGLKTVVLHAFQLLLCLIQLWCPFIEAAILQIDLMLYVNVRYFNYIMFYLVPRCLSPLIYGLRDEKFFLALKYYALCGMCRDTSLDISI